MVPPKGHIPGPNVDSLWPPDCAQIKASFILLEGKKKFLECLQDGADGDVNVF